MSVLPDFFSPAPPLGGVLSDDPLDVDEPDVDELSSALVEAGVALELEVDELLLRLSVL